MIVGHLVVSVLVGLLVALAAAIAGLGAPGVVLGYASAIPATLLALAARTALPLRADDGRARSRATARSD